MAQNRSSAVMQQCFDPHDSLNYFPTPPWATRALCEALYPGEPERLRRMRVWEPACGQGFMARPLGEYFETVFSSDVHPYGFGAVADFLLYGDWPAFDWIITNPPFRLAAEFAHTAIDRASQGAAILVRSAFLEGTERYASLFAKRPPMAIVQFSERVPMVKGRCDGEASTATAYCWIVWSCRPHKPVPADRTMFHWFPPVRRRLERAGDYHLPAMELADARA